MKKLQGSLSLSVICLLLSVAAQAQSPTSADDTARADALLKQMTTEEKIGQLNQPFYSKLPIAGMKTDPVPYEERIRRGEVGSFLFRLQTKHWTRSPQHNRGPHMYKSWGDRFGLEAARALSMSSWWAYSRQDRMPCRCNRLTVGLRMIGCRFLTKVKSAERMMFREILSGAASTLPVILEATPSLARS